LFIEELIFYLKTDSCNFATVLHSPDSSVNPIAFSGFERIAAGSSTRNYSLHLMKKNFFTDTHSHIDDTI
jgi:hypothetical protein